MMVKQKKNKKFSDDDISQYCESVEKLLERIHEKSTTKKRKKTVKAAEERVTSDEEMFVLS